MDSLIQLGDYRLSRPFLHHHEHDSLIQLEPTVSHGVFCTIMSMDTLIQLGDYRLSRPFLHRHEQGLPNTTMSLPISWPFPHQTPKFFTAQRCNQNKAFSERFLPTRTDEIGIRHQYKPNCFALVSQSNGEYASSPCFIVMCLPGVGLHAKVLK
jgi:hypothetical protein